MFKFFYIATTYLFTVLSLSLGGPGLSPKVRKALIKANSGEFVEIKSGLTQPSEQLSTEKYFKGFRHVQQYTIGEAELRQLKIVLLSNDSYHTEVIKSCSFIPDLAIEISSGKDKINPLYILISSYCKKIFVSQSKEYFDGKNGTFLDITSNGFSAIKDIYANLKNPFIEYDESKDASYKKEFLQQIKLIESLLNEEDQITLEQLEKNNTLTIIDSLIVADGNLLKMNILIEREKGIDHDKFLQIVGQENLNTLKKLMELNIAKTTYAPVTASVKDPCPTLEKLGIGENELPEFPWPPPEFSDRIVLHSKQNPLPIFEKCQNIGCLTDIISRPLEDNNYSYSYYLVSPGDKCIRGVVLATMMEQFNKDNGRYLDDESRRVTNISYENLSFLKKLKALIVPKEGYFRVLVFVITDLGFLSKGKVTQSGAKDWVRTGAQTLPNVIAELSFKDDFTLTALIYEFRADKPQLEARKVSGILSAQKHLEGAQLNALLRD